MSSSLGILDGMSPVDISLPARFKSWRPVQAEAIEQAIYGERRFQVLAMPTGTGKSLAVVSASSIAGYRTVILTSTKGLQDQYVREFPFVLTDIRGRSNYECQDFRNLHCEEGHKAGCRDCTSYGSRLGIARNFQTVVTNYKYWFNINRQSSGGLCRLMDPPNPIELLVLDEAHLAPEELAEFLAIHIYEKDLREILHISGPDSESVSEWRDWAKEYAGSIQLELDERLKLCQQKGRKGQPGKRLAVDTQELVALKRLEVMADKLHKLTRVDDTGWVCEKHAGNKSMGRDWEFDPVWPGLYAERVLFHGIPRVILSSATVRPKTMSLLGVKASDYEFREWERIFPANRSPVYHIPSVRMNYRTTEDDLLKWVKVIDEIIASRLTRKGIIHTVSYARQEYLFKHSKFSSYMVGNLSDPDAPKAAEIVKLFKRAKAPSILVSPSFGTGWDFPGTECEWQIIAKLPFPNSKAKVMQERCKRDPQYLSYLVMQELVQATGRGMRSFDDRCETFIVDDSINWFLSQNKALGPKWFEVRRMAKIPPPPMSLTEDPKYRITGQHVLFGAAS